MYLKAHARPFVSSVILGTALHPRRDCSVSKLTLSLLALFHSTLFHYEIAVFEFILDFLRVIGNLFKSALTLQKLSKTLKPGLLIDEPILELSLSS